MTRSLGLAAPVRMSHTFVQCSAPSIQSMSGTAAGGDDHDVGVMPVDRFRLDVFNVFAANGHP